MFIRLKLSAFTIHVLSDEKDIAAATAQELWDRSVVAEMFKAGKVKRARFGFEEVETKFCIWLGGLEDHEQPWRKAENRTSYLADLAQRETLINALDVTGYREHAHISPTMFSDHQLLVLLHQWRAISKYIPDAARKESETWLGEHDDMRFRSKVQS